MRKLVVLCLLAASPASAQPACRGDWDAARYRSYGDVQGWVRAQLEGGRILKISLCGEGESAYFQVLVLRDGGSVTTLRAPAARP